MRVEKSKLKPTITHFIVTKDHIAKHTTLPQIKDTRTPHPPLHEKQTKLIQF